MRRYFMGLGITILVITRRYFMKPLGMAIMLISTGLILAIAIPTGIVFKFLVGDRYYWPWELE